ncbi:ExbD/TolR family protein [Undibacterium parvum]|jgi:biopolymer transport protein ExbD|uniref:Biopolymer transporter ExbD n=2 Tax=Undibacterium TaxID=401469 RepID=A0A3Q9BS65_9BURK|nr:biopolymer transporter ExbD [Undibacterium parvum]AZP11156.1 biopolymer transporter ExbD [Undibacterium parvum]AZP13290.1 biopolymer transporter ExbD [Undibacterium parvum]
MSMAPSASNSSEPEVMMEMNMTPLIDVMLVLIIMLIITIPPQNHAINLNMPVNTPSKPTEPPPVINIDIDFDGTVLWNGTAVPHAELETKLQVIAAMPDQAEVHIRPDKLAAYKAVAAVMASAQRLGVTKIGMVGNEQFLK